MTPLINIEKLAILNITECVNILKKAYNLSKDEDIIIINGINYKKYSQYIGNNADFILFSTSLLKILDLELCKISEANISITDIFNNGNLLIESGLQKKMGAVTDNGYNAFKSDSDFYTDI